MATVLEDKENLLPIQTTPRKSPSRSHPQAKSPAKITTKPPFYEESERLSDEKLAFFEQNIDTRVLSPKNVNAETVNTGNVAELLNELTQFASLMKAEQQEERIVFVSPKRNVPAGIMKTNKHTNKKMAQKTLTFASEEEQQQAATPVSVEPPSPAHCTDNSAQRIEIKALKRELDATKKQGEEYARTMTKKQSSLQKKVVESDAENILLRKQLEEMKKLCADLQLTRIQDEKKKEQRNETFAQVRALREKLNAADIKLLHKREKNKTWTELVSLSNGMIQAVIDEAYQLYDTVGQEMDNAEKTVLSIFIEFARSQQTLNSASEFYVETMNKKNAEFLAYHQRTATPRPKKQLSRATSSKFRKSYGSF